MLERYVVPEQGRVVAPCEKAIEGLTRYLDASQESRLREHQKPVAQSVLDSLKKGDIAGYLSLPTGFGKTVVAAELIGAMNLNTVILSPTRPILLQTHRAMENFASHVEVGNYYTAEKNLGRQTLNTTYTSFLKLIEQQKIDTNKIELLICDEIHTALGEERHTLFKHIPQNALKIGLTATPYFEQLAGYKERNIIKGDEHWLGVFTRLIHEMSLEEAIEKGILTSLDVHLFTTDMAVDAITISPEGAYDQRQLEKYLNTEKRNYLTIGLLAGLHSLSSNISFIPQQVDEMTSIHEKIRGKRTVVFGLSINHVEQLADKLRRLGISAQAVHGKLSDKQREQILQSHKNGEVQVVLGVNMLQLGWDSPETEVGIFLAPTQSGIVATQELGRILRPCEETQKHKSIAIQLVDDFTRSTQAPILIPDIFDPYYVLRGTQIGSVQEKSQRGKNVKSDARIQFFGGKIHSVIDSVQARSLLRKHLKGGSIIEIAAAINHVASEIYDKNPGISSFDFYELMVKALPYFVRTETQRQILQAMASIDTNVSSAGRTVFLLLNLKTIMNGVEGYKSKNAHDNEEMLHEAIAAIQRKLTEKAMKVKTKYYSPQQVFYDARAAAASYIAKEEQMGIGMVLRSRHKTLPYEKVRDRIDVVLKLHPCGIPHDEIESLTEELAQETEIGRSLIKAYINRRNAQIDLTLYEPYIVRKHNRYAIRRELEKLIEMILSPRDGQIVKRVFFDGDSFEKVGKEFGLGERTIATYMKQFCYKLRTNTSPNKARKEQLDMIREM